MSKEVKNLPAYTNVEHVIKLVEAYKRKNNIEQDSKPFFGLSDFIYKNTKSALRLLGLIEIDSCLFTQFGKDFAFGNEEDKKGVLLNILVSYGPYESLLNTLLNNGKKEDTAVEEIVGYWGKFDYSSTDRNRKEAASFLGSMIEYLGLGKYVKGRGSNPTRIIWEENARDKFNSALNDVQLVETATTKVINESSVVELEEAQNKEGYMDRIPSIDKKEDIYVNQIKSTISPENKHTVIVKVDMTSWEDEKIRNFFKYLNGEF